MCRVVTTSFDDDLTAPAEARRWIGQCLEQWDLDRLADTALLLTSEVVTNAVVHAHSRPVVSVSIVAGKLEIGVSDKVPLLPASPDPGNLGMATEALGEGGRGLLLITALADTWGVARLATGKHIWFHLDIDDWDGRNACVCARPHPERVRLASGRYARDLAPVPPGPDATR